MAMLLTRSAVTDPTWANRPHQFNQLNLKTTTAMKALKTTLSVTLLILFAGCATVTDANVDLPEDTNTVLSVERAGDTWDSRNG